MAKKKREKYRVGLNDLLIWTLTEQTLNICSTHALKPYAQN